MKKILFVILFVTPIFLFAQETRTLDGLRSDGYSWGKKIPDTVRTLIADSGVVIISGGASLVDTLRTTGGGGGGSAVLNSTQVGYGSPSNFLTGDANFTYNSSLMSVFIAGYLTTDTIYGTNVSGGSLHLFSTSNATPGKIYFGASSAYDGSSKRLGLGNTSPSYMIDGVDSINALIRYTLTNKLSGTSAESMLQAVNDAGNSIQLGFTSTGYTGVRPSNDAYINSSKGLYINTAPGFATLFNVNSTLKAALYSNGNFSIGTTDSTSGMLNVAGKGIFKGGGLFTGDASSNPASWDVAAGNISVINSAANARMDFGQASGAYSVFLWKYNATPSLATFDISTAANNNSIRIDSKSLLLMSQNATGTVGIGLTSVPAFLSIVGGTTSIPQMLLTEGVAPTSPANGDLWTESATHRIMYRQNGTSIELLGTSSVNTVSPTSPNRTITVVINGTTYYIAAKTTND